MKCKVCFFYVIFYLLIVCCFKYSQNCSTKRFRPLSIVYIMLVVMHNIVAGMFIQVFLL